MSAFSWPLLKLKMGKRQIYSGTKKERQRQAVEKYRQTEKGKLAAKIYAEYGGYEHHLKSKYGITFKQYNQMLKQQDDVCAICGKVNLDGKRLFVDHNHKTGKIRGLLCKECNTRFGILENEKFIKNAKKYLGERN